MFSLACISLKNKDSNLKFYLFLIAFSQLNLVAKSSLLTLFITLFNVNLSFSLVCIRFGPIFQNLS